MHILYVDEAGNTGTDYDNPQQPIFSLSGIIVDTDDWNEYNKLIDARRKEIIPEFPNCEFHATDIYSGKRCKKGTFDYRQFSLPRILKILEQLVDLIVELDLPIISFVVRKNKLKNYCKWKFNSSIKIDPYLIAFPYVSLFFDYYLLKRKTKGMIFLDSQNTVDKDVDILLDKLRLIDDFERIEISITNIIERALFVDSTKSNFIQLSDICNFYVNRYNSMNYGLIPKEPRRSHIIEMYKKIEPLILPPARDPFKLKDMLTFFDDNKDIFSQKIRATGIK